MKDKEFNLSERKIVCYDFTNAYYERDVKEFIKRLKEHFELIEMGMNIGGIKALLNKKEDEQLQEYTDKIINCVKEYFIKELNELAGDKLK